MRARFLSVLFITGLVSCLPSAKSESADALKGDHLFRGVLAGSGSGTMGSGTFSAIYLDPANAAADPMGSSARSGEPTLALKMSIGGQTLTLKGPVKNRHASLTSSDGSGAELDIRPDDSLHGDYHNKLDGTDGKLAGVDNTDGKAQALCGTYSGSDSGTWNFVISSGSNLLAGSFYGGASGDLSGTATTDAVSFTWAGSDLFGGAVSGTASGTRAGTSVTGTWSGSGYSGSFQSAEGCAVDPDPSVSMSPPGDPQCGCSQTPIPAGGACCAGGPAGSYCCAAFQ